MALESAEAGTKAKRRRGAHLTARVFEAALAEVAASGLEHFSVEAVAQRAGTNKSTIYRRWGGADALVIEALKQQSDLNTMPDTGTLRGDLVEYARRYRDVCRSPAMLSTVRLLLSGSSTNEAVRVVRRKAALGEAQLLRMIQKGARRGDIPPGADLMLMRTLLLGGLQHLLLFHSGKVADERLEELVDGILRLAELKPC